MTLRNPLTSAHRFGALWANALDLDNSNELLFSPDDLAEYILESSFVGHGAYNVLAPSYGAVGTGLTDDRHAFVAAQTACGTSGFLYVPPGTYLISSNLTITSPILLALGAKLKPASGVTITLNAPLAVPLAQCFDPSAGGSIRFGTWRPDKIFPQWWGATGAGDDGVTADTTAILAAVAAANAIVAGSGYKRRYGASIYFPAGTYLCTSAMTCYPGVTIEGDGLWTTVLVFKLANTVDALTWDRNASGYVQASGFGYGGAIRDIKATTLDFTDTAKSCRHLVATYGVVDFVAENVSLNQAGGHLLHIEDAVGITLNHVRGAECKGDAGLYIGSPASISTTVRGEQVYFSACQAGPNFDVAGLSIDFFGLTSESAGSGGTQTGAYGFRGRYGAISLTDPYFEDNGDADMWLGSDANATTTTVSVTHPRVLAGSNNLSGKSALILDRVSHAVVDGGDLTARTNTVEMTSNCGAVDLTMYVSSSAKDPILTSGAHWRTKSNLNYRTGAGWPQVVTKTGILRSGTMVTTIPVLNSQPSLLKVFVEVYFEGSANLRALLKLDIAHAGDGFSLGGMTATALLNGSTGNFQVATGDFVATYSGSSVVITYTCGNGAGAGNTNLCQMYVDGTGIAGTVTAA